ncbi:MAG: MFS transporter, partial [Novosphingobium sp.]|nr:MFS transporter [Novosphingobium sp.]
MTASHSGPSALKEWGLHWPLAVSAAIGYSATGLGTYSIGPMTGPLQAEFGWSRAQITMGLTITGIVGALMSVPVGILLDRVGPRRVGIAGMALTTGAFALLSTATGDRFNWLLLWSFYALAFVGLQATVWTSAIAANFERSRGAALAFTMSGGSVSAVIVPITLTYFIEAYGWRIAFLATGSIWAAVAVPLMFLFFRGARDGPGDAAASGEAPSSPRELHGVSVHAGLRSPTFYKLLLAAGLFTFTLLGLVVHFVPILRDVGVDPLAAAGYAALIGIFSIVGRLGTGFLLDRFAGNLVGAVLFSLPVLGCALLLLLPGSSAGYLCAAAAFGLTLGAELEVIAYLASWHFGLRNLGILMGALTGSLALGSALGPLAGAAMFDHFASYSEFLILTALLLLIAVVAVVTL